jgi:hypothetical protein
MGRMGQATESWDRQHNEVDHDKRINKAFLLNSDEVLGTTCKVRLGSWSALLLLYQYHSSNLIEMTNKMQLCRTIYYSIVP